MLRSLQKILGSRNSSRRVFRNLKSYSKSSLLSRRRPLIESLETRALLAGFVGIPNDPDFPGQWELHNTGQNGAVHDADIDAPEAWTITTGSMATVLAVIDDGVDYTNPDLYLNIWLNQGEIPAALASNLTDTDSDGVITFRDLNSPANASFVSNLNGNTYIDAGDLLANPSWENGLDEDGNGFSDDLVGWDFEDNDNDPYFAGSHGTIVAPIIGADANNGVGGAGINWRISMMPVRYRNSANPVDFTKMAVGLDYAVAEGAPISALFGGNYDYSQAIYDSINAARLSDHLVIAPSANDSANNDVTPRYPASFDLDNIISAMSVNQYNEVDAMWNYGATSVDLAAPTQTGGGTTGGAARTAGVAALLKSAHPDWTYAQIKDRILSTVDQLPSLAGKCVTGGRLNAANALGVVQATKFYVVDDATTNRTFEYGSGVGLAAETYALSAGNAAPRGAASTTAGDKVWVVDANKTVYIYNTSGGLLGSWSAGSLASNATVEGITTNGTDVWIVDGRSDKVYKYTNAASRLSGSQNAAFSFNLNSSNTSPKDLVTDGASIWVVNNTNSTDKVFKYTVEGSLLGSWTISSGGGSPTGITIDPSNVSNIWIVDNNTDRVYQFDAATSRMSGSQSPSFSFALATGNTNPQGIADPPPPGGFPNDPNFPQQWPLHNTGQTGGLYDADIDMPEAWSISTGSIATIVAVLDGGLDYTHPDLYLNMWLNQGEIANSLLVSLIDTDGDTRITFRDLNAPANSAHVTDQNGNGYIDGGDLLSDASWENGLDEDGNGMTDDLVGWDFRDDDNDPSQPPGEGNTCCVSHATSVAQIIAALGNNGVGTAGVMWTARIIPVRIQGANNTERNNGDAAAGLDYAVAMGATVSSNSWGDFVYSQLMFDSIDRARQAGHLFITSAGNDGVDLDVTPRYPAAYDLDNILSVMALDANDRKTSEGSWGLTSVDIGAPTPTGANSQATPHVTGVAGLLRTLHPDWTYAQIKAQILATVDPLPSLTGTCATGGRLNAANALGYAWSPTKFYVVNDATFDQTYEYETTVEFITANGLATANSTSRGVASTAVGDKVWVVDANKYIYVYGPSGSLLGSWLAGSLVGSPNVQGITTNGNDIWIVDAKSDKVHRYTGAASRLSGSQNAASSFALTSANKDASDLVTDGTSIWVLNNTSSTDKVFKYNAATGAFIGSWTITGGGGSPTGITLDPSNATMDMWIVDNSTDRVYRLPGARTTSASSIAATDPFSLASGNSNPQGIADPPPGAQLQSAADSLLPVSLPVALDFDKSIPPVTAFSSGAILHRSDSHRDGRSLRNDQAFVLSKPAGIQLRESNVSSIAPIRSERVARASEGDEREAFDEALLDVLAEAELARYASVFEN